MKSGLKYTQSFGKCNEQDMTFRIPCAESRHSGARRQHSAISPHLRAACANPLAAVVHGRSAHVTGRRIGGQTPVRASGCSRKQQTKWYRGERPVQMHRLAFVFEEDGIHLCVLSFMRTEAFFTPPGRFACPAFGYSRSVWHIAGCRCERKERGIKK